MHERNIFPGVDLPAFGNRDNERERDAGYDLFKEKTVIRESRVTGQPCIEFRVKDQRLLGFITQFAVNGMGLKQHGTCEKQRNRDQNKFNTGTVERAMIPC
ncbi:MAG: hypothetical protein RBT43_07035, partial [bacterium]|nr:hypothetical protein [bacterium]